MSHRTDASAADRFFSSTAAFHTADIESKSIASWLQRVGSSNRVALVTSGGTAAPLEQTCVRFVDNFSTGARATSLAECLLEQGYSVLFLYRSGSKLPYMRRLADTLTASARTLHTGAGEEGQLAHAGQAVQRHADQLQSLVGPCMARLLCLPFTTVEEYLWSLRGAVQALSSSPTRPLLVMAAAVSDFYCPRDAMPEHKIQSDAVAGPGGPGSLSLTLYPVPKVLHLLPRWCPGCTLVSFKLETDPALLLPKAAGAITLSGVHAVVANLLQTRYEEVKVVVPVPISSSSSSSSLLALPTHAPPGAALIQEVACIPVASSATNQTLDATVVTVSARHEAVGGTAPAHTTTITPPLHEPLEQALASVLASLHESRVAWS